MKWPSFSTLHIRNQYVLKKSRELDKAELRAARKLRDSMARNPPEEEFYGFVLLNTHYLELYDQARKNNE